MTMVFPRIRGLREDHDLTQQQVADALFLNRRTYAAYEAGVHALTAELLIDIAAFYSVSVDYLLGLTDQALPCGATKKKKTNN